MRSPHRDSDTIHAHCSVTLFAKQTEAGSAGTGKTETQPEKVCRKFNTWLMCKHLQLTCCPCGPNCRMTKGVQEAQNCGHASLDSALGKMQKKLIVHCSLYSLGQMQILRIAWDRSCHRLPPMPSSESLQDSVIWRY